ncbi:MAG: hypothetical protein HZA17_15095, partial [Nitrospirae bacterium]|nr:hypothetical protein [Nitrospirota bacterium]
MTQVLSVKKKLTILFVLLCLLVLSSSRQAWADPQITGIQINQALGVQKDNHLNFVAGKSTAVRAFLNESVTVNDTQTLAVIKRTNEQIAVLAPKAYDSPTAVVDFLCPSLSACGNWAAGNYWFEVSVNGLKSNTDGIQYAFQERSEVRVLAMPVKANYNGTVTQVSDNKWKTMWQFTQRVYPLADDKLKWKIREEFDASSPKYNLETEDGTRSLWEALTSLMPAQCSTNPKADGCYDLIVGFISDRPNVYPNGKLQGFTYGRPTNIVVAKDEDAEATVAHEIAHVYGIGDTYAGGALRCNINPSPDGFVGSDWNNRDNSNFSCSAGKTAIEGISATLIPAAHYPYEVGGRGPLGNMACYMGSGGLQNQYWSSQETYDHLFNQLAPGLSTTSLRILAAPERHLYFAGFMRENGEILTEPWESFMDSVAINDSTGSIMVRAIDSSGTTLASKALQVQFYILSTPPEPIKKLDWAPFEGAIRFPSNTAKFQIVKDGAVLKEVSVSSNAPTVSNVTPIAAETIPGPYTVTWDAGDMDGDPLSYTIEYNPDITNSDSEWLVLINDLNDRQWNEDFGLLPGGSHARIRVKAGDGVLTTTAESAEFSVPLKSPEVFIEPFLYGNIFKAGTPLFLEAEVFDLQDEWLPDNRLQWTSNLTGSLGQGSTLV